MGSNRAVLLIVLCGTMAIVPVVQAQIKHIEMRVEGMT
jgi:hypothetical protein